MSAFALFIHLVRVFRTDAAVNEAAKQVWIVAVPREDAAEAVQEKLPAGLRAVLGCERLPIETVVRLQLHAGELREMTR